MTKNKGLRLVIDTNLWISFLISNRLQKLDALLRIDGLRFLFSKELLDELARTMEKPKLQKYFAPDALEEMLQALAYFIEIVTVKSKVHLCRDPNDDFLLALAKDGNAAYLLTGDRDLLELSQFENTRVLTITQFLSELEIT